MVGLKRLTGLEPGAGDIHRFSSLRFLARLTAIIDRMTDWILTILLN